MLLCDLSFQHGHYAFANRILRQAANLLWKIALFHKVSFSMFFQQDTVIFERLQDKQMYMDSTVEHLEDFAKEGT